MKMSFERMIFDQTQQQILSMWYQFRPFGDTKKYNELEGTTKYIVDTYIRNIKENIDKIKKSEELKQKLIDTYNNYFNRYGLSL